MRLSQFIRTVGHGTAPNGDAINREKNQRDLSPIFIRGVTLWGFDQLVETMGGDPHAMLEEVGLPANAFDDRDALISFEAYARLIEIGACRLNRANFGLEWSRSLSPRFPNLGGLLLCAILAPTLREWLDLGLKYWKLHTNGFTAEFVDDGHSPDISLRSHINPLIAFPMRQFAEHVLANQVQMTRVVTGFEQENPTLVRFQHFRPKDISVHEAIFRCPVEFDAPVNEVVFDRKYLDYSVNGKLSLLQPLVHYFVKHRIQRMPMHDLAISMAVAQAIPSVLGTGHCNIEFIADSLGWQAKKLQRLLAQEQTSFSEVLETTRKAMAQRYLTESNVRMTTLAGLLDYSSLPAFTLAFKRWNGLPPLAYRKRERAHLAALREVEIV
jgi:AraC-like DNA-binding protein